ncbi:MAG: hypothetical protein JNL63_06820 [Bacteroidia bacterium]|nr:hypothetical protein [Bacteroidia bacterium]
MKMNNMLGSVLLISLFLGRAMTGDCQRTIQPITPNELKVEITINKSQFKGFARLAEFVPEGSVIKYAKTEGGTFMVQDNKIKFIWLTLPKQDFITASYVIGTEALKAGKYPVSGKFSYTEGEQTKEIEIPATTFTVTGNQVASSAPSSPVTPSESTAISKVPETKSAEAKTAPETKVAAETKASKVTYSLQLLSTKDKLAGDYFSKKYQIADPVRVETVDGLNKYMLGEFRSTEEAVTYREGLTKKGCKDAFVVPYSNNKRITSDEAKRLESGK